MTKLIRGMMYGKAARVDAYFANAARKNFDNHREKRSGPNALPALPITSANNGNLRNLS